MLVLVLLSAATAVRAQEDGEESAWYQYRHPKLFQGRLLGGFNFCQVTGDTYAGYHKVGINAGALVYAHIKPELGVSLEMIYSQKGVRGANVKESYTVGTYFDKYYLNLNYVESALMLHLDEYLLDYEAGVTFSALIKSDEWAEADVPIYIDPKLTRFNPYEVEYVIGLTLRTNKRWSVSMRYQYSATSIRPWDRVPPRYSDGSPNQRNEVTVLRLMYKIR